MDTKKLRQKILDLAIRGKLVPQDPNDEPASVLIEKIRAEKEQLIKEKKIKRDKNESYIYRSDKSYYEKFADGTVKCIDEEVPFEIPENWEWCRGYTCFLPMVSTKPTGDFFRYIDIESVDNKRHCITSPKVIQSNEAPSRASRKLSSGDTLFSMVRPYLENIAFIYDFHADCIASTGFYVCKPNEFLSPEYCFRLMTSLYVIMGLNQYMKGDNSPSINNDNILSWLYPIPPLSEQQRIVSTIEQYNNLINELEENKEDLKQFVTQTKSKILDLAIRGKLVPQDPNDELASTLLERIKSEQPASKKKGKNTGDNSHYAMGVPESWELVNLGILFDVVSSKRVLKSEWTRQGIPFYRAREIVRLSESGFVENDLFISNNHFNFLKKNYGAPAKGDIMLSAVGSIGKTYIVKESDCFYYKDASVLCLKNHSNLDTLFYSLVIQSSFIQNQIYGQSKGTTVDTITIENAKKLQIPLPPLSEQKRIVKKIEQIFASLDEIANSIIA